MKCFKRCLILTMLGITIAFAFIDISYAIYFAVLTNTMINIFWTANIFGGIKKKNKPVPFGFGQLLTEENKKKTKSLEVRRPIL